MDTNIGFTTNHTDLTKEETTVNCDTVWDMLSAYADGEATSQEQAIVQCHVAECTDCARDLEFMQSTSGALQTTPEVEPPATLRAAIFAATVDQPSVAERLSAAVRRTFAPAPMRYGSLAAASAAAAFALVAFNRGESVLPTPVAYNPTHGTGTGLPVQGGILALGDGLGMPSDRQPPAHARSARITPKLRHTARAVREVEMDRPVLRLRPTAASGHRAMMASLHAPVSPAEPYRAKVASAPVAPDEAASDDTRDSSDVATPAPAVASAANTTIQAAAGAAQGSDSAPRVQLIASSAPVGGGQARTLAELRRALSQQGPSWTGAEQRRTLRDHEIRVDVVRGSF